VLAQRFGVARFGEPGEDFDPTVHEALLHSTSDEVEDTSVSLVLQPGYRVGERVVRAARVAVVGPE
jgi:molecular chaperone GrpE